MLLLVATASTALAVAAASGARAQPPVTRGGTRADGLVALVGGAAPGPGVLVILRSDVELRARIRLTGREGRVAEVPLSSDLLAETLDELIGETLIAREAERVRVGAPEEAEVLRQREAIEQLAGGADLLAALQAAFAVPDNEIDAIARRRALVGAFLEANLAGAAQVSDEEVEREFAAGLHPFVGQELGEVRESMRLLLARRALDRSVRRWVAVLRARTTVRLLGGFG